MRMALEASDCLSTDEWIKEMWDIYIMEYSATKRNEIMPFAATWMDLEFIILSEVSQRGQISDAITYIWHLKKWWKWTFLKNRNRLTDTENKLMVTKGGRERWDNLGVWD